MTDFTEKELRDFERLARDKAESEARLIYPPSEYWRIRIKVSQLTERYFREYTGVANDD